MKNFALLSALIATVVIAPISFAATDQQASEFLDLYNNPPSQSGRLQESMRITVQSSSEKELSAYAIDADIEANFEKVSGKIKTYYSDDNPEGSFSFSVEGKIYLDKSEDTDLLINVSDVKQLHYDEVVDICFAHSGCEEDRKQESLEILQETFPENEWGRNEHILKILDDASFLTKSIYEEDLTSLGSSSKVGEKIKSLIK